jgi:hypothetical protein
MAFTPVSLPIQEILLSDFVTDIASISNTNDLLLKDKLEDLINIFEMDLNTISIGTDNPINYVKAGTVIAQGTGFVFQTNAPVQVISKIEKNVSNESVFTIDRINANLSIDSDEFTANDLTVNTTLVSDGAATFNSSITSNGQFIESKETVILDLTKTSATEASARLTLTSSSRKNIFVTLKATTAPTLNPVYDGSSAITAGIIVLSLYVDFDSANPPAPNSSFNIYVVDVTEQFSSTTIIPAVTSGGIPFVIEGGTNLNAAPTAPIILHDNISQVGTNPSSTVVGNNQLTQYGQNASLLYIVDQNSDDRLVITGLVGMEFF